MVELEFDANYPTGGYADASLKRYGANHIDFVIFGNHKIGTTPHYDTSNDRIQLYKADGTEETNNAAGANGEKLQALVFARY